jgi:hypothetical protein
MRKEQEDFDWNGLEPLRDALDPSTAEEEEDEDTERDDEG